MSISMTDTVTIKSNRHGDRQFRRVREEQYRRLDGSKTLLLVWRTANVRFGGKADIALTCRNVRL